MSRKAPVNENPTEIDITEVLRRIPHRYPFLLVDRAEDYKPSESIVGIKCVTFNEPFFAGHFPEYPVMPGVLIVEALAQTGAVLMSKSLDVDVAGKTILFISVKGVKHRGDLFKFKGQAMVGDKVAAEAEFAAMVVATQ